MDLKERYFEEVQMLKNIRIKRVVDAAKVEFYKHGIIGAKIRSIAKRAQVGEASVYRYFEDKVALAKVVAFDYWNEKSSLYLEYQKEHLDTSKLGLEQLSNFMHIFIELYNNHREFLKFLEDFDTFMMSQDKPNKQSSFEQMVLNLKEDIINIVGLGQKDGSIKADIDPCDVYQFVSQVLVATTQKLAIRAGYLITDEHLDPKHVICRLIEMHTLYIKNEASL
jgi:AcrR family transcriptional regulator